MTDYDIYIYIFKAKIINDAIVYIFPKCVEQIRKR